MNRRIAMPTPRLFPSGSLVAWMTLAILLLVTTVAWYDTKAGIEAAARIQFASRVGEIERAIRAEGYPDYAVQPPGLRDLYTSILYLEPFLGRNLRAFDFDMYSEPVRRAAMQRARDNAVTAISGRVVLVQETSQDVRAGFLMYSPVYRMGREIETVEQRRADIHGFVYSPFRMTDLMRGIIGRELPDLTLRICDGEHSPVSALMYNDGALERIYGADFVPAFQTTRPIALNGHVWTLELRSAPYIEAVAQQEEPRFVLMAGVLISFLVFAVVWSAANLRARATTLAEAMTAAYRRSEGRLRAILDHVVDGIITVDEVGLIKSANPATESIFGWTADEMVGKHVDMLIAEEHRGAERRFAAHVGMNGSGPPRREHIEVIGVRRNGERFQMELAYGEVRVDGRSKLIGVVRDVTERKNMERIKNEFVAIVSHELRTPLTSIRGSLSLIAGNAAGDVSPKAKRLLGIAFRNCDRLIRLINDVLDIQKIEAGRMAFQLKTLALQPLLEQSIEANVGFAEQFGVVLELEVLAQTIAVRVDADRFVRVIGFVAEAGYGTTFRIELPAMELDTAIVTVPHVAASDVLEPQS